MSEHHRDDDGVPDLGWIAAAAIALAAGAWLLPASIALLHTGGLPPLSVAEAVLSLGRIVGGHLGDPAAAYPPDTRALLPGALGWWGGLAWTAALVAALGRAAMLHVEPLVARERLGRRAYDWRGARPRAWARPRDLRIGDRRAAAGFSVGHLDGRQIRTDEESHVTVIAPTRAGKTTRCIIPWLLEHDGPAVVTSTKRDVLDATRGARGRTGHLWIFDPFGPSSMSWSPLAGCRHWSHALRQAQWLADASSDGDSEIARYWRGEAAKLLAPLLHAAALADRSMLDVLRWVDNQSFKEPSAILTTAEADAAGRQLWSVDKLDARNKGTTFMSAGSVLGAYRYPELARPPVETFTIGRFLASAGDTLYLVAAERHQRLLAPILVALISSLVNEAAETGRLLERGRRLRLLLDEAANIVPLGDLPRMLSQAAGHGIRFATVWQSLAQLHERHGQAADTILANSTTKLFMGPITDHATRSYVIDMLGSESERREARSSRPKTTAAGLQQLQTGRALLLMADRVPGFVELRPYWMSRVAFRAPSG